MDVSTLVLELIRSRKILDQYKARQKEILNCVKGLENSCRAEQEQNHELKNRLRELKEMIVEHIRAMTVDAHSE
jgi:hypothetical protein